MAKRKSSPRPTSSSSVVVRSTSAPARRGGGGGGKKRSLLSRVAIAAAAGMVTAFGLYYIDKVPGLGPWMRDSDDETADFVPLRAALVYAGAGALATYLTYKVTKGDVTSAAGPAAVTASMAGIELYKHFAAPEETAGLGRLGNATPYGASGTNAGNASALPPGTTVANLPGYRLKDIMFVTDADGNTFEVRPAPRPGSSNLAVDCRDANGRPVPCPASSTSTGPCTCPPGISCKRPCAPRVPGCPTGSPPAPMKDCNVWAGPLGYC